MKNIKRKSFFLWGVVLIICGLFAFSSIDDANVEKQNTLLKKEEIISYDKLQQMYLDIKTDINIDDAELLAKESGLPFAIRNGTSSKSIIIAYEEEVAKTFRPKEGDYLEIVFDRETALDFPFGSIMYCNVEKGFRAIELIRGGYRKLDNGMYVEKLTISMEKEALEMSSREEQIRYIHNNKNTSN